jgi:hypothetical protein
MKTPAPPGFNRARKTFLPFSLLAALFGLALSGNIMANVPLSKKVVLSCPTDNEQDFKTVVAFAREIGATDVDISDLPKDRWQWFDPADPYPNWSMRAAGILKIMVPPELRPAIPTNVAERSQAILAARGDILRKNGLNAFFHGCEPMWLPEAVYLAHPDWRGPTCQAPERSRHNYYAPDIDNPAVLALYRKATTDLCRIVPIDNFDFLTGDSGSGLSWDPQLYTGPNGPAYCKDRPLADRKNSFMATIHDGAKGAGLDAAVAISTSRMRLVPSGWPLDVISAGDSDYGWSSKVYPVVDIPDPVRFAEQLEAMFARPDAEWRLGIPSLAFTSSFDLIRYYRRFSVKGPLQRAQALDTVAAGLVGEAGAANLTEAWQEIHDAILILQQIDNGGPILLLGTVNQRWLVRPLVPYPLELQPAEKGYRRFQFQGNTEENAANLMNLQGLYAISGDAGTNLAHDIFQHVLENLRDAHGKLQALLASNGKPEEVKTLDLRIQALILVVKNADITARYQDYLEHFTPGWSLRPDRHGHPTVADGKNLVAEDEANTRDLINLIKSTNKPLIAVAPSKAEEDVFQFGPDLLDQLDKKIEIEEAHLPDLYRL